MLKLYLVSTNGCIDLEKFASASCLEDKNVLVSLDWNLDFMWCLKKSGKKYRSVVYGMWQLSLTSESEVLPSGKQYPGDLFFIKKKKKLVSDYISIS